MPLLKNTASQKIAVYAYDTAADGSKTGDAANITAQISLDGGATAATNDVNPTELDATDAPGIYIFDMTQAETNADIVILYAVSSTADIKIEPYIIYTNILMRGTDSAFLAASAPTNFPALGINVTGHVSRVTLADTTTTNTDMVAAAPTANQNRDAILDDATRFSGAKIDEAISAAKTLTSAYDAAKTAAKAGDKMGLDITDDIVKRISALTSGKVINTGDDTNPILTYFDTDGTTALVTISYIKATGNRTEV